jgi:hypothetical protein
MFDKKGKDLSEETMLVCVCVSVCVCLCVYPSAIRTHAITEAVFSVWFDNLMQDLFL